jgi:hypothetical protein
MEDNLISLHPEQSRDQGDYRVKSSPSGSDDRLAAVKPPRHEAGARRG